MYQLPITRALEMPTPGRIPFSVEFMPPRDDAAEARLWDAAEVFHDLGASFVSVTYGAGGSSRERTARIARRLAQLPLTTLVHLTLVNHTIEELTGILKEYAELGLSNLLALRGDPPGDPLGEWQPIEGGLTYANELIELVRSIPECAHFEIGIASFPEGHYRAKSLEEDTHCTIQKLRAGADFSITQMFFDVEDYLRLRDRLIEEDPIQGSKPIIPGLMPITSLRTVQRITELSGSQLPRSIEERLIKAQDHGPEEVRKVGIEITSVMADRLIREGAPDIHFMTLNNPRSTQEVLHNLGMAPAWNPDLGQDALH